ncbi:hypothetical protein [Brevibacillus massiliensis]|uniref:hypothetical protein n=1 Tax=Brevibacillus massiliensis TaxID=1118054 RepID=UPI00164E2C48|nr:hypothetical protein [Brevibacillus massiliensis]
MIVAGQKPIQFVVVVDDLDHARTAEVLGTLIRLVRYKAVRDVFSAFRKLLLCHPLRLIRFLQNGQLLISHPQCLAVFPLLAKGIAVVGVDCNIFHHAVSVDDRLRYIQKIEILE